MAQSKQSTGAVIQKIEESLFLIVLPVDLPGFDNFIGAWVYCGAQTILVDPGPAATVHQLLGALAQIGVRQLDLILLTHIHIDHAGGAGLVAAVFPRATVVCHSKAVSHLIDPQQLWQGSLKTLGPIAEAYGPFEPVAANRLLTADRLAVAWITPIVTPGHAPHHYSYHIDSRLFAGEAAGVCLPVVDGGLYLRPATPPRFFMETYLESLERLIAREPRDICYGHLAARSDGAQLLAAHRDQINHWYEWVRVWFTSVNGAVNPVAALQACRDELLLKDPLLAPLELFPPGVQEREKGFLLNAVKGFWGYLTD